VQSALAAVSAAIPMDWRRGLVERADLDRFLFAAEDVVVAVGQDGLVANLAKYLQGQPVLGVNAEPGVHPGVLVALPASAVAASLLLAGSGRAPVERRTMVEAVSDDGQRLTALNEIFLGHPSHQSARYRLRTPAGPAERQSSSGVIVGTGTGATGWCRSIGSERGSALVFPRPCERSLVWFVREAWPSPATVTAQTEGVLGTDESLALTAESDGLVVFGDGIERDRLVLCWGQQLSVRVAPEVLCLVRADRPTG